MRDLLATAERLPDTKGEAENRLRVQRAAVLAPLLALVAAWLRWRRGRGGVLAAALVWAVLGAGLALGITQVQLAIDGPAHFL